MVVWIAKNFMLDDLDVNGQQLIVDMMAQIDTVVVRHDVIFGALLYIGYGMHLQMELYSW